MSYKKDILELRGEGCTYDQICEVLGCTKSTVSYYCKTYSLSKREKKVITNCLNCDSKLISGNKKYCSSKCQHEFQRKEYIKNWKAGLENGYYNGNTKALSKHIRNYLLDKYNNSCIKCGWNKLHPIDSLPLVEINHIDGNAEHCMEGNLEVLCPNCHSMTPNFRARNPKSARIR